CSLELEDDRRILSVENDNVDLLAEAPLGIHDVGLPGLVSPGQVSRQQVDPNGLARISLLDRMAQYRPGLAEPPFDVVMQAAQQRRERPVRHWTNCAQLPPRAVAAARSMVVLPPAVRSSEMTLFVLAGSTTRARDRLSRTYSRHSFTL